MKCRIKNFEVKGSFKLFSFRIGEHQTLRTDDKNFTHNIALNGAVGK